MKLVIDDKIPYIRPYVAPLGSCLFLPGKDITADAVRDADVLIVRTRTRVDAGLLRDSRVRLVLTATIGYDHLDTAFLQRAGIAWRNCPGCNARSVAQYVGSVLPPCRPGLSLGLVGCGHVGTEVKALAERLGWRVLVSDPPLGLHADLTACDVITYHVPLTHDGPCPTYHMASADFFRRLTHRPMIINASRGGVVDEAALLQALDDGLVGSCVIDCWEGEPHVNPALLQRALVATPHIAGYSANGKATATWMTLRHLLDFYSTTPSAPLGHLPLYGEAVRMEGAPKPFLADFNALRAALPPTPLALLTEALGGTLPALPPYDARTDSDRLKAAPEEFERLRGNYPLRLEEA